MRKLTRNNDSNTCLTDAIAYYFGLNRKRVPFFIGFEDWQKRVIRFYRRRGLYARWSFCYPALLTPNKVHLVIGLSPNSRVSARTPTRKLPRGASCHAVLYKGNKPYYDSNASQRFLKGRPRWILLVSKNKNV